MNMIVNTKLQACVILISTLIVVNKLLVVIRSKIKNNVIVMNIHVIGMANVKSLHVKI